MLYLRPDRLFPDEPSSEPSPPFREWPLSHRLAALATLALGVLCFLGFLGIIATAAFFLFVGRP
jgi:hypothetical protein